MTGRILVVDDDPDMLALLDAALKSGGYSVDATLDGSEAVKRLASRDYDVLLADLNMPGVSGMDVLEATRQLSPDTVAVVVTTRNSIDSAVSSLKAGAFDFLPKPVDVLDLLRVVRRAVEHRQRRLSTNIQQATSAVFSTLDARDLPPTLVELSVDVLAADHALLLGYVSARDDFDVLFESGGEDGRRGLVTREAWGHIGRVVTQELEPLLLPAEYDKVSGVAGIDGATVIAAPLVIRNQLFGVLAVSRGGDRPYGRMDVERVSILAAQAVLAMDNAYLIERLRDRIDALERARSKLTTNEALEGIGQLATGLAHQLHAPAGALQTHLRAAAEEVERLAGGDDLKPLVERIQYALDAAQRIALVAGDLSRLSRSREDVLFDLVHAVEAAERMGGSRISAAVEYDASPAQVRGNPGQLSQAVLHLLVNASLAVAEAPEQRVTVRVRASRGQAVLEVEDTGRGMSEMEVEQAFQPFVTFWSGGSATGLGLSTAREIVERHDGIIGIASEPGRGTTVTVRLPAASSEADELMAFGES